jgi:hypothetical protein
MNHRGLVFTLFCLISLLFPAKEAAAQGFSAITPLNSLGVTASTGEKPQSKVWTHDGKWWTVMPNATGTHLWRLDGITWTFILTLSANTDTHADCKVTGTVVHILLYRGTSSSLVSIEYVPGSMVYQLWTIQPSTVPILLDAGVETATIDIDGAGRMWLASAGTTAINVRWSDSPYNTWSAAITIASGVADDDICAVIYLPGKTGVLWSNQNTQRFGFKTHTDGDAPGTWSTDEVPASQSAQNVGLGMADDHLNMAVAADGTLFCAVKTSYDMAGSPKVALLVRRPGGTWDDLYGVSESGTRPIVLLNESAGKIKVFYSSTEGGGNILYKESPTGTISLSSQITLITGTYNDVTSTKQNYTSDVVILASNATQAVGVSALDGSNPLVCHLKMEEGSGTTLVDDSPYHNDGTTVASPTWTAGVIGQALNLNGTSQYATLPDAPSLDITNAITLVAWVKPAGAAASTQYLVKKATLGSVDGYEISLSSAGKVFVRFNQSTSADLYRINSITSYPLNGSAWIHIAATFDQSTGFMKLYINGVQEGGDLAGPASIIANNIPLGIGAQGNGVSKFNGILDEVQIYNIALTGPQILALAAIIPSAPALATPANGAASVSVPPTLSWSAAAGANSYRVQVSTLSDFSTTVYDQSGIAGTSIIPTGVLSNTLYYWRVNAISGAGTSDWSSVWSFTSGTSGSFALDFNGSNNFVDCGNDASLHVTNFTLEAWVKREGTGVTASSGTGGITDIVPVISKGRGEAENAAQDVNYILGYQLSTNKVIADFEDNATSANHPVVSNGTLGECWTHIAVTYTVSGVWKLYINGILDQTTNLGATFTPQSLSNVKAGIGTTFNSTGATGGFFNGLIDEVRIWNVVRSESEIAAAYSQELSAATGLSARYGLNSGSGAVAVNSVGPNGTISGTPVWVGGFLPMGAGVTSLDFNGTSDYVTFGAAPGLNSLTFTLEAWIKIQGSGVTTETSGAGGGGLTGVTASVPIVAKGRGETETPPNMNMNYFMGLVGNKLAADFEESGGLNHAVIGNTTIPSNTWTHVAATYDPVSATWNLYVNGVPDISLDLGADIVPVNISIQHASVGTGLTSAGVAGGFFNGLIDEVRIWNTVRTPAEILAGYSEELSTDTGLLGRWGFNEGCGTIANNSIVSGVNGTLSSATGPVWVFDTPLPGNQAPDPANNPSPADQATASSNSPDICVNVNDQDDDDLQVRFYGRPKPATSPPFTIVWLPDTQYYVEEPSSHGGTPAMFNSQTAWAITNEVSENIVYVGQLGDCVEHGDYPSNPPLGIIEWNRAMTAMYALEKLPSVTDDIPYGVCAGNHDQSPIGDPNGTTNGYNNTFGIAHFTGKPYYGGHNSTNNDNHYQVFSASGIDFLVIGLEYDQSAAFNAPGGALDWAEGLVISNPTKKIIVMSHYVLSDAGSFSTQGQYIYSRLKIYPNFILMVGGHDPGGDGEAQRTDVFGGNTVHTILADYQGRANGGNGLMRIFKFEPAINNIAVKTYSPFTNSYETDPSSQFNLAVNLGGTSNPFNLIGELNNISSGSNACVNWAGLDGCTEYEWYVETFDGIISTTSDVWTFTTPLPTATISYPGSPYNTSGGTASVSLSGTNGGLYSALPAGLTLNTSNGNVTLASSTPGTYTVTYTIEESGNCPEVTTSTGITITALAPSAIVVKGNNTVINNRALTVSPTNHTDFGSANVTSGTVSRTFTIENIVNGIPLPLDGTPLVTITDLNAVDFTVLTTPSTPVEGGGSTTFSIEFNPSGTGLRSAIVVITHKDLPQNPFIFTINGFGL